MQEIDNFKSFVRENPNLINYVKNKKKTWQEFYELYDLYGNDSEVWNKYLSNTTTSVTKNKSSSNPLNSILEVAKNIDADKLQDGLTSIQKAVDLFGGLLIKDKNDSKTDYSPRPVYKRFDD